MEKGFNFDYKTSLKMLKEKVETTKSFTIGELVKAGGKTDFKDRNAAYKVFLRTSNMLKQGTGYKFSIKLKGLDLKDLTTENDTMVELKKDKNAVKEDSQKKPIRSLEMDNKKLYLENEYLKEKVDNLNADIAVLGQKIALAKRKEVELNNIIESYVNILSLQ